MGKYGNIYGNIWELVGGANTPSWKMMDNSSMVGGWHPIYEMEHNPAMFQTTNQHGNEQFEHLRMVISWWSSWSTDSALWKNKNWLVVEPPLWKIWKSVGMILANIWKNNKCSKPPTREWWLSRTFDLELAVFSPATRTFQTDWDL